MAKTNLLIIPIGWLIYADKLYLEEKSTRNSNSARPEDIHSEVSNLLTGKGKISEPPKLVFMSNRNQSPSD